MRRSTRLELSINIIYYTLNIQHTFILVFIYQLSISLVLPLISFFYIFGITYIYGLLKIVL